MNSYRNAQKCYKRDTNVANTIKEFQDFPPFYETFIVKNVEEDYHKSPRDILRRDSLCRNTEIDHDEVIEKVCSNKKEKKEKKRSDFMKHAFFLLTLITLFNFPKLESFKF